MKLLDEENFFERAGLFMDRAILKKFLENKVNQNWENNGSPELEPEQLNQIIEETSKFIIQETFEDLLGDGLIEVVGVDENGEFLYGPKKN